jgi:hypothetical protein
MARMILALSAALALALPAEAAKKKAKPQEGATPMVTCKDGSQSAPARGACSHHGGVGAPNATAKPDAKDKVTPKGNGAITDKQETSEDIRQEKQNHGTEAANSGGLWSRMAGRQAKPPERTSKKSGSAATALCKDGSSSYSQHHSGTCSGHGGVEKWLDSK